MANTVFKLRRSSVAGKFPNTSTLATGELAINLTDRKLFSSDGTTVFELGSNVGIIHTGQLTANLIYSVDLRANNSAIIKNLDLSGYLKAANSYGNTGLFLTSNGSAAYWANPSATIDIPHINQSEISNGVKTEYSITGGYDGENLSVYVNGIRLNDSEANVFSGSNVSFTTAPANGALIEFFGYKLDGTDGTHVKYNFSGDGSETTFSLPSGFDTGKLNVFLNGVRASNSEIDVSSGNSIIFNTAPTSGSVIDAFGIKDLSPLASYVSDVFTADGVTTVFNSSNTYNANRLSVYLNGVRMSSVEANTASGSSIVFSTAPANGAVIETFGIYTALEVAIANADIAYTWTNVHTFSNTVSFSSVSANGSLGSLGQVLLSNGSAVYWGSNPAASGANTDAQFIWTNTHTFTNTVTFNQTINGTANSTLFVGSLPAANVVSNAQLSSNLANYQTTAGLSSNVATLTSNNTSFVGSVSAANVVSNAQLSSNLANYVAKSTIVAFSAAPNSSITQTITSGSQQKALFQVEDYDTNNNFANSRFTPTVAGYYQLNSTVRFDGSTGTGECMIVIRKNGSEYKRGWNSSGTNFANDFWSMSVSTLAYANGAGDYFEVFVQQGSGSDRNITVAGGNITYFNGFLAKPE
jgi:hypothetical protein